MYLGRYSADVGLKTETLDKVIDECHDADWNISENDSLDENIILTKGLIYEIYKYFLHSTKPGPATVLYHLLGKPITCNETRLREKMKGVFSKQMKMSGNRRDRFLAENFKLPITQLRNNTIAAPDIVNRAVSASDVTTDVSLSAPDVTTAVSAPDVTTDVSLSAPDVTTAHLHVPLTTSLKKGNLRLFHRNKKQKWCHVLDTKIAKKKEVLAERLDVYYKPMNVDSRERSKKKTIAKLRATKKALSKELNSLKAEYESLKVTNKVPSVERENAKLKETISEVELKCSREQKLKSYYKLKPSKKLEDTKDLKSGNKHLLDKIEDLEYQLSLMTASRGEVIDAICLHNDDHSIADNVRLCVMELLGLEVSIVKVPLVIQAVVKHILRISIPIKDLPSRQSVLRISDEAQYIVKLFTANKIIASEHLGVNKDGTSRQKVKILETSLTLDTNEELPLGYHRVAREDAATITSSVQGQMNELAEIHASHLTAGQPSPTQSESLTNICGKITYLMSDRAANEKKANQELIQWLEQTSADANLPARTILSIHCMAHVLLAFHSYGVKNLTEVQDNIIVETNLKLGRDANGAFFKYGKENAASRVIRMTSELLGPNGDEKNGLRDKWTADCRSRNVKSLIGDYKDNRFNGIFEVAAQLIYHSDEILSLEKRLIKPNLKVISVLLDLKDSRVVTMVQALAVTYVQITEPYWRLVVSKDVGYDELPAIIQKLKTKTEKLLEDPDEIFNPDPVFTEFPPKQESPLYHTAHNLRHPDRKDMFQKYIRAIAMGILTTISNQLTAFLPGGDIAKRTTDELSGLAGSGLTNLQSERHFGSLDASQRRRRHATFHYHSTILLLKTNRQKTMEWLNSKPKEEKRKILKNARKHGAWLRQKHRREEAAAKVLEEKNLEFNEAEKTRKAAKLLLKKAKAAGKKLEVKKSEVKKSVKGKHAREIKSAKKKKKAKPPVVQLPDASLITVNKWVAVAYENGWFPGTVTQVSVDGDDFEVEFLKPSTIDGMFKFKQSANAEPTQKKFIFDVIDAPVPVSGGRSLFFEKWKDVKAKYEAYKKKYF